MSGRRNIMADSYCRIVGERNEIQDLGFKKMRLTAALGLTFLRLAA
jgi:hypothetical protein